MPIAVICPSCSARIQADEKLAGKKRRCPKCESSIQIPAKRSDDSAEDQLPAPSNADAWLPVAEAGDEPVEQKAYCPYCSEVIKSDAKKCKHCGEFLDPAMRSEQKRNGQHNRKKDKVPMTMVKIGVSIFAAVFFVILVFGILLYIVLKEIG